VDTCSKFIHSFTLSEASLVHLNKIQSYQIFVNCVLLLKPTNHLYSQSITSSFMNHTNADQHNGEHDEYDQELQQQQEVPAASNTILPLHTSQSVPILYRSVSDSFASYRKGTDSDQRPLVLGTAGQNSVSNGANTASDLIQNPKRLQVPAAPSYMCDEEGDADDDDDTFENNCDIEDQAAEESQSSVSLTSYSLSVMSSKLARSMITLATEEVTTSSDSDDLDARVPANTISFPYSGATCANSQYSGQKVSKIRRNDCSISSIGTYSKYQKNGKRVHIPTVNVNVVAPGRPTHLVQERKRQSARSMFCLILAFKIVAAIWISAVITFVFYHVYLYNPSSPLIPTMDKFQFISGKVDHIPVPAPEHKVSVVLMNHSRPRMIKESTLVPTLLQHPSVEEVVILHTNPKTQFNFVHPKVINIDATKENDQMGLSVRFYFCQLVKSDWVLHVDDDMEFTEKTMNEMLSEFAKNTKRIVGRYGRDRKEGYHFNGYYSKDSKRETEVILTKFMVMERDTCSAFFQYSHLIWEDIILNNGEGPLWNGEDIFMSLVSNHVYGYDGGFNNYAMDWLDVWSAPEELKDYSNGKYDISGGYSGIRFWDFNWWRNLLNRNRHYSYRGKLWKEARDRLESSGPHVLSSE
jgi:hypothetical protein